MRTSDFKRSDVTIRQVKDRVREVIRAQTRPDRGVEVVRGDSLPERPGLGFLARSQPLVLRRLCSDWPLTGKSFDRISRDYGDVQCEVRVGDYADGRGPFRTSPRLLREYVREFESVRSGSDGSLPPYAAYQCAPESMLRHLRFPDWFEAETLVDPVHFWLGPRGTYTGLHSDTCDKLVYQAVGLKTWWLVHPMWHDSLYLWPDFGSGYDASPVRIEDPDLRRHPRIAAVVVHTVVLSPGDLLVLPGGWYHAVRAAEPSLAFELKGLAAPASIANLRGSADLLAEVRRCVQQKQAGRNGAAEFLGQ